MELTGQSDGTIAKATLRLYFELGARVRRETFWERLWAPSLGSYLMDRAKRRGSNKLCGNQFLPVILSASLSPMTFLKHHPCAYRNAWSWSIRKRFFVNS